MSSAKPRDLCERTFLFACEIVRFCRVLSLQPGPPRQIAAQLLKAGTSVGANTEEARVAYSRREFASKNSIVLRECHETRYWLRLLVATEMAKPDAVESLLQESNELVAIFTVTVRRAKLPQSPSTPE